MWNEGYTKPKWQRLDNQDVEKQKRSYRVMNYSAKVSNKVERASNVLESNVRLDMNTGNREKEDWVDEARRNGKWEGRGGKDGRTARNTTGNEAGGKAARKQMQQTERKRWNAERATHKETGNETDETEMSVNGLVTGKRMVRTEALSE